MRVLLLLLLPGCNALYDLDATRNRDAAPNQFFDAPPDAPFGCPAGEPRFKEALGQLPDAGCNSYTLASDGRALAACPTISQGWRDGALESVPLLPDTLRAPRIFPEGDRAFMTDVISQLLHLYARSGETWSLAMTIGAPMQFPDLSNPSRGPAARVILIEPAGAAGRQLTELVESNGTLTPLYSVPVSALGVTDVVHPSLSNDGLRLVFVRAGQPFYATRPDLASRFGTATRLSTVPVGIEFPFLTEDCGYLYFSAENRVAYVEQE